VPEVDLVRQRELVDAFLDAAHGADFDALVAVLDEDVVLRIDRGARPRGASREVHGALAVAKRGVAFARLAPFARRALVNGGAGLVVARHGRLLGVAGFTVAHGKIVEIDLLMDPGRLRQLEASSS
jgi:RNA polymerase sigma-70 factor (ECF subfamily)